MSSEHGPSARGLLGALIMIFGALWALLSGLCSAIVTFSALANNENEGMLQGLAFVAAVGGGSMFIGWLIFLAGRALRRGG